MIRYAIVDASVEPMGLDVEFVQLRDKSAEAGELYVLAERWMRALEGSSAKLLVNHRVDVALAVGAHGVHLTGAKDELTAEQVRRLFGRAIVVSVSCHSVEEVRKASADLVLFGPVFEKRIGDEVVVGGVGLEVLAEACRLSAVPVLALGGVSVGTAGACIEAGAAGVAGIRMFR